MGFFLFMTIDDLSVYKYLEIIEAYIVTCIHNSFRRIFLIHQSVALLFFFPFARPQGYSIRFNSGELRVKYITSLHSQFFWSMDETYKIITHKSFVLVHDIKKLVHKFYKTSSSCTLCYLLFSMTLLFSTSTYSIVGSAIIMSLNLWSLSLANFFLSALIIFLVRVFGPSFFLGDSFFYSNMYNTKAVYSTNNGMGWITIFCSFDPVQLLLMLL